MPSVSPLVGRLLGSVPALRDRPLSTEKSLPNSLDEEENLSLITLGIIKAVTGSRTEMG